MLFTVSISNHGLGCLELSYSSCLVEINNWHEGFLVCLFFESSNTRQLLIHTPSSQDLSTLLEMVSKEIVTRVQVTGSPELEELCTSGGRFMILPDVHATSLACLVLFLHRFIDYV